MYNSSFKVLEDVVRYAKVWEQGLSRISELKSDGNLKAQLEVREDYILATGNN